MWDNSDERIGRALAILFDTHGSITLRKNDDGTFSVICDGEHMATGSVVVAAAQAAVYVSRFRRERRGEAPQGAPERDAR